MKNRRRFRDLTIRDNFMFAAVMMQEENCKKFLEMLLGIDIKQVNISYEKSLIYHPEYKGIRLDVYASDENNTRYDIEMQIAKQDLGKRTRYYHSQMDMEILESGKDYKELPTSYVIFICNFDPFKKGKYCYTFENRCLEDSTLSMEDASRSIFLSTEGKDEESIPKELKEFLRFVKEDTPEHNLATEDSYVKELLRTIGRVKESRKWENGFMSWEAIRWDVKHEGRLEGRLEAQKESVLLLIEQWGEIPASLRELITSETNEEILKEMLKVAARSTSLEEFEEKITNLK